MYNNTDNTLNKFTKKNKNVMLRQNKILSLNFFPNGFKNDIYIESWLQK